MAQLHGRRDHRCQQPAEAIASSGDDDSGEGIRRPSDPLTL